MEKKLKVNKYLAKLWTKVWCYVFFLTRDVWRVVSNKNYSLPTYCAADLLLSELKIGTPLTLKNVCVNSRFFRRLFSC